MQRTCFSRLSLILALIFISLASFSQQAMDEVKPFSGSNGFRKWTIGLNAGGLTPANFSGGNNDFSRWLINFGYGANIRYQLNHYLAFQGDVIRGTLKGNQDKKLGNGLPPNRAVTSFNTDLHYAASLSGVISFGNINFLRMRNKIVPYVSVGGGIANYEVKIVKKGTTTEVPYPSNHSINEFFVPLTVGLKYNLTPLINLDLGYREHFVDGDNFDGFNSYPGHKDKFSYGFLGVEFSLGKRTRPQLLFNNPAFSLTSDIQRQLDSLKAVPPYKPKDSDGDGVADEFDLEPNTPKGCPVDTHGIMRDTDGDGVPDCKDKELNTPTMCQPVDADGVGKCPVPDCCKTSGSGDKGLNACSVGDLPSISFKGNSTTLTAQAKAMLAVISGKLKANTSCTIAITGYPSVTKAAQGRCQKRLAAIKSYLSESEGITDDRITTTCDPTGGDENTVDIKGVGR